MKKRTLKIEERGDYAEKKTIPTIRLKGQWLRAAGFPPGLTVELTAVSPGVIEIRLNPICSNTPDP